MPRNPVHLTPAGCPTSRDVLWAEARKLKTFTIADLAKAARVKHGTAHEYVRGLVAAGYLELQGKAQAPDASCSRFQRNLYRLVHDCGIEAPRVRRDGSELPASGRERMWRTMRVLGDFTVHDLVIHASAGGPAVAHQEAETYCRWLARAGYLRASGKGEAVRFRFIKTRYSGPRPPMIQRVHRLWDPNLGKVVYEARPKERTA